MEQRAIDECRTQMRILSSKLFKISKKGTRISYKIRGNFYDEAAIRARAGKATGKNKHWINIEESGFGAS